MSDVKLVCQRIYSSYAPYEAGAENSVFILAEQACIVEDGEVKCLTAVWWSSFGNEIVTHVTGNSLFDLYVKGNDGRETIEEIKQNIASAWGAEDVNYMKDHYPQQYAELIESVKQMALISGYEID